MTYQFKIQLKNLSNPTVWRRIIVPSNYSFEDFHRAIQFAFGWEFSHQYFFSLSGYTSNPRIEESFIGDAFYEMTGEKSFAAESTLLSEIFVTEKQKFSYLYDSGDDWMHQITLEKILPTDEIEKPILLKGKGACPPEDCGGPWGYENLRETLADKKHPDHKIMKDWLGMGPKDIWDAEAFDLEATQQILNLYC